MSRTMEGFLFKPSKQRVLGALLISWRRIFQRKGHFWVSSPGGHSFSGKPWFISAAYNCVPYLWPSYLAKLKLLWKKNLQIQKNIPNARLKCLHFFLVSKRDWSHNQSVYKKIKSNNICHIFKHDCCVGQDRGSYSLPHASPSLPPHVCLRFLHFQHSFLTYHALSLLNTVFLFSTPCISSLLPWIIKPSSSVEWCIVNTFLSVPSTEWHSQACHWPVRMEVKTPDRQNLPHWYAM